MIKSAQYESVAEKCEAGLALIYIHFGALERSHKYIYKLHRITYKCLSLYVYAIFIRLKCTKKRMWAHSHAHTHTNMHKKHKIYQALLNGTKWFNKSQN